MKRAFSVFSGAQNFPHCRVGRRRLPKKPCFGQKITDFDNFFRKNSLQFTAIMVNYLREIKARKGRYAGYGADAAGL